MSSQITLKNGLILLLLIGLGLTAWAAEVAQAGGLALPAAGPASSGPMLTPAGNRFLEPAGAAFTEQPGQWRNYTDGNKVKALAVTNDALWTATSGGVLHWSQAEGSYVKYTTTEGLGATTFAPSPLIRSGRSGPGRLMA